jgi:hypothetical protein
MACGNVLNVHVKRTQYSFKTGYELMDKIGLSEDNRIGISNHY